MTYKSKFYYPVTLHKDTDAYGLLAPWVTALPLLQQIVSEVVILELDVGAQPQGLYVFDGKTWHFIMPMPAISASIIFGDVLSIYINKTLDVPLSAKTIVYKNGQLQRSTTITHGTAVYATRLQNSGTGSSGNMTITAGAGIAVSTIGENIIVSATGTDEGIYQ